MDAWRSPRRILDDHLEDQPPNLLRGWSSANWLPDFGDHSPIQMKTSPVPADHRFWCDNDERQLPTGPDSPSKYPEEPVEGAKARPCMPPLQHGELLAEHKVFQDKIPAATKEADERAERELKQCEHGSELYQIKPTDVAVSR